MLLSDNKPKANAPQEKLSEFSQGPIKRDFGVQVEMDYGIPIIVYPYMFQRNRNN